MGHNPINRRPYKKRRLGYRHAQMKDDVKLQGKESYLQQRREALEETTLSTP